MPILPFRPVSRDRIASASVLVVGDAMLDRYWFGEVDRISPEAPVPIVHVRREEYRLGGAANVARNVAALGAQVSLLSVIGDEKSGVEFSIWLSRSRELYLRSARRLVSRALNARGRTSRWANPDAFMGFAD